MTKNSPTVRIADATDAAQISGLLFEFNGEGLCAEDLAQRLAEVGDLETVFLGEAGGSLAGVLVLRIAPTLSGPEDWAEITEMYVRPGCRRQGVGRALVETAVEYARARGCTEVHLLVDPENAAGLAFYAAVGFGRDSWEMVRQIL